MQNINKANSIILFQNYSEGQAETIKTFKN